jgi:hypothetical protein
MYETVLFWAVHLGFDEVTVMGWDLGDGANHEHFYKDDVHRPGYILPWEIEITRNAAVPMMEWMETKGTSLSLDSPLSSLSDKIPRVAL